ncbi:unnamed protein product [Lepidochelys olivacea]
MAEGHSKPFLCVDATDELLFSGSKGSELQNVEPGDGPGNRLAEGLPQQRGVRQLVQPLGAGVHRLHLLHQGVGHPGLGQVRPHPHTSSGQVISGDACAGTTTRTIASVQGEHQINQIALNPAGTMLYAAAGNSARIWELNRLLSIGKLTGHIEPEMCLTVNQTTSNHDLVVTGSKDHYVKRLC